MTDKEFIEAVFELAFGDNAINRNFTYEDAITQLREFSDDAVKWDAIPYVDKVRLDSDFEPTD